MRHHLMGPPVHDGELADKDQRCRYCHRKAVLKFMAATYWIPGCGVHWDQARIDAEVSPEQLELAI